LHHSVVSIVDVLSWIDLSSGVCLEFCVNPCADLISVVALLVLVFLSQVVVLSKLEVLLPCSSAS